MSLIEKIKRSRVNGAGAKGLPNKGLYYCSRCGKRSRSEEGVQRHIADVHGGVGQALKEPTRTAMMAALIAAERAISAFEKYRIAEEDAADAGERGDLDASVILYGVAFDEWDAAQDAVADYRKATGSAT